MTDGAAYSKVQLAEFPSYEFDGVWAKPLDIQLLRYGRAYGSVLTSKFQAHAVVMKITCVPYEVGVDRG